MSGSDFLDKLLTGVAVVWMPLGQVGEFIRGNGMQKKDFVEAGFPAIHYGQIYTRYGLAANTAFTCVEDGLAKRLRKAKNNDLLLATTSENDEDVVKPLAWFGNFLFPISSNGFMLSIQAILIAAIAVILFGAYFYIKYYFRIYL